MAALNIFKKREKKEITEEKSQAAAPAWQILQYPRVTEKANDLAVNNQYVFKVYPSANKIEIRKAIENLYGVKVLSVQIINVPRRRRRLGRIMGWRRGYKKAIVGVEKGKKIEIMPR